MLVRAWMDLLGLLSVILMRLIQNRAQSHAQLSFA